MNPQSSYRIACGTAKPVPGVSYRNTKHFGRYCTSSIRWLAEVHRWPLHFTELRLFHHFLPPAVTIIVRCTPNPLCHLGIPIVPPFGIALQTFLKPVHRIQSNNTLPLLSRSSSNIPNCNEERSTTVITSMLPGVSARPKTASSMFPDFREALLRA